MADNKSRKNKNERNKVNSSQQYEVRYLAELLGVSVQAINGAKRATGSNDRKEIEKYISDKQNRSGNSTAGKKSTSRSGAGKKRRTKTETHKILDVTLT